jgi:hypothetical protein
MEKGRQYKGRTQGAGSGISPIGRFEYDRADEKRKIHEEIEDFLTERLERKSPPPQK